jgi:hypothetical protein
MLTQIDRRYPVSQVMLESVYETHEEFKGEDLDDWEGDYLFAP